MELKSLIFALNLIMIAAAALVQSRQWPISTEMAMNSHAATASSANYHPHLEQNNHQLQHQMKQQQLYHHQMKKPQNQFIIEQSQHHPHTASLNNNNNIQHNDNRLSSPNADHQQQHQPAPLFALNKKQHELVKSNPGSFQAVARAFKMAIQECKYQMRDEPWNCTVAATNTSSIKPSEIFGLLMSRSFKETSFIQSLISSAIAHSITRACTESTIMTCGRKLVPPHGNADFSEDIEFGKLFARRFMESYHELPSSSDYSNNFHHNSKAAVVTTNSINFQPSSVATSSVKAFKDSNNNNLDQQNLIQNAITASGGLASNSIDQQHQQQQQPMWKERKFRHMINAHNDEVGRLQVFNGMRRVCKCHGLSGTCTLTTCWNRLAPFREIATRLKESLDQALRVEMYAAQNSHYGQSAAAAAMNRYKSMTSQQTGAGTAPLTSTKKSNKKRSSSSIQSASMLNGLGRSSPVTSSLTTTKSAHHPLGAADFVGAESGGGGGGGATSANSNAVGGGGTRLQAFHESSAIGKVDGSGAVNSNDNPDGMVEVDGGQSMREFIGTTNNHLQQQQFSNNSPPLVKNNYSYNNQSSSNTTAVVKKRPVARSIGITAATAPPGKFDLLYAEESPDFCIPSERYNIKGTKGRQCSESGQGSNSCEKLCCGRGYITEIREEKYKCECKFKFCCKLDCNICTRRKTLHKCL